MQVETTIYCDFCSKSHREVEKVIVHAGPSMVHGICNECIGLCNDILKAECRHRLMLASDIGVEA